MKVTDIGLGVLEVVPQKFGDQRGFFAETWQQQRFEQAGLRAHWIQDNQSFSASRGVLRGLHLQLAPHVQSKLIRVLRGAIFDVAVDVRHGSPTFGNWVGRILSSQAFNQLMIPGGFAHGFLTLEENVEVFYKVSAPYDPATERSVRWDDPDIGIEWPLEPGQRPLLSVKDEAATSLAHLAQEIAATEPLA